MDSVSRWLSDLGIEFSNSEESFSNGYLLGKILYSYGFQPDFGQFSNKSSYSVPNMGKVQLSLEQLSIKFDPHRIINKEPGYSTSLLIKIHKALHNQSFPTVPKKNKHSLSLQPETKVNTDKFEDFRFKQLQKIFAEEKSQKEKNFNGKLKERQHRIDVLKSNKTFMMTWQGEGMENWKKNMNKKKERVLHEKTVNMKLMNDKKNRFKVSNEGYSNDTNDGIKEFEKNMIRLGIDYVGETEKKVVKSDIAVEAAATIAKIKENKNKSIEAAKERDVRQRNAYIEQKRNEKFEIYKKASSLIGNLLSNILQKTYTGSFQALFANFKKTKKFFEVEKNVENLKTQAGEKWKNVNKKWIDDLEAEEQEAKKALNLKKKNFRRAILESKLKSQEIHFELLKPVTYDLLTLAEEVYSHLHKESKIPGNLWKTWLSIFKSKKFSSSEISRPISTNTPFEQLPVFDENSKRILNSYISGEDKWGPIPNTYTLSDILEFTIESSFPLSPPPPVPEGPHYLPLKILFIGPRFAGKKLQSKKLAENFGLKILEMPKILEDAKKVVARKSEPEDTKKKKIAEEEPEIFVQAALENSIEEELGRARIFRARIRGLFGDQIKAEMEDAKKQGKKEEIKIQGFGLISYPTALQEAVDLERQLSGFVHPSELPTEKRDLIKKDAEELIKYRPKEFVPVKLFNGAWDVVIWIELEEELAGRRAAERRVDPAGNQYNLLFNPPADNILAKCKTVDWPGEEWLKQEYLNFNTNKPRLMHWFSMFGCKGHSNLFVIDGSQHPDVVFESIKSKVQEILNLKNNPNTEISPENEKIDKSQALELYSIWEELKTGYLEKVSFEFGVFRSVIIELDISLAKLKEEFSKVAKENDEKQAKAQDFIFELNGIISGKTIFSKQEVDEVNDKVDDVSDALWDFVSQRKHKLVSLREQLIETYGTEEKLSKIAKIALGLYQAEGFKYSKSVSLISTYKKIVENEELAESNLQIPNEIRQPLEESLELLQLKVLNMLPRIPILQEVNDLLKFRLHKITDWVKGNLKESRQSILSTFDKLDLYITQVVSLENQAINEYIQAIRQSFKSKTQLTYQFPSNFSILKNLSI